MLLFMSRLPLGALVRCGAWRPAVRRPPSHPSSSFIAFSCDWRVCNDDDRHILISFGPSLTLIHRHTTQVAKNQHAP
jgi:hypothetical protein